MEEVWKPIKGYEGLYEVSNLGQVKSLARKPGNHVNKKYMVDRIRKLNKATIYLSVSLDGKGKPKCAGVHRLVLETFKPTNRKDVQVNHIDGNKLNNKLENLEWVTSSENHNHAYRIGIMEHRLGENLWNSKLTNKQTIEIKRLLKEGKTLTEIAKKYNVTKGCISHIKQGRNWKNIGG